VEGDCHVLIDFRVDRPIFLQLAEAIEDDVLDGRYAEDGQIVSTTDLAVTLRINPATANKAISCLVDEGVIYKRRGVGMFMAQGARDRILKKRRERFRKDFVDPMLHEAAKLGIAEEDVIAMIKERGRVT